MCHEWWMRERWMRRGAEEAEPEVGLWDEFGRARPISEPDATDHEGEVVLEQPERLPAPAGR